MLFRHSLTTCAFVGANRSDLNTVERLHYMKDKTTPFACTRARSITFEFYDPTESPALFTAPRNLTVDDCVRRLTSGVGYTGVQEKVIYSVPSSRAPSPPPSPEHQVVSPTESSVSISDYEDLADQLNQSSMTGKHHYPSV